MSSTLSLPRLWVFIEYEDGRKENVGNTDTLDTDEAHYFWKMWNKPKEKQYVRYVSLENKEKVYEKYEFNNEGRIIANKYIRTRLQGEW